MHNYIESDFNSLKEALKQVLKNTETFKDFDFEGANISVIIELFAYIVELNTYYINKIAQNLYMDTANLYNTVHRLANQKGYIPKGHISSTATLSVIVSGGYADTQFYIPEYSQFFTEDGLSFVTTRDYTINVPASASDPYTFEIGVKEGTHERLNYTGRDLVDYSIILPTVAYDNDNNLLNDQQSIKVYVNNTPWIRVGNFFQELSGLSDNNNVYSFLYNKYQNYILAFSSTRNYPGDTDDIVVDLIRTSGSDGSAGPNTITEVDEQFITDLTTQDPVPLDNIVITNPESTRLASDPETVEDIKVNADATIHRQFRVVTAEDFSTYIEERPDIISANVWGEKEIAPSGDVQQYNKVHLSVIPHEWKTSTISTTTSAWVPDNEEIDVLVPTQYSSDFKMNICKHVESRKILNTFEVFHLPELVYFYLEMGLIKQRIYNFNNVVNAIKDKLIYYFDPSNRDFNEIIDFRELVNYIRDITQVSPNNFFRDVAGIRALTFRDIIVSTGVYEFRSNNFPQYYMPPFDTETDNMLRPIKLGLNQFPKINRDSIVITNEGT